MSPQVSNPTDVAAEQNDESIESVQEVAIINDGPYTPLEKRQTGWIIKNISGKRLNIKTKLVRNGGDSDVILEFEEVIELDMKPEDEIFVMVEVSAPPLPYPYHVFFKLVLFGDEATTICDTLRLSVMVRGQFSDEKERKIKRIYQMGFNDRKQIVQSLKKWSWNELKAVNWLATTAT